MHTYAEFIVSAQTAEVDQLILQIKLGLLPVQYRQLYSKQTMEMSTGAAEDRERALGHCGCSDLQAP